MKITYRPEIDGLRAVAVAAVIIYHANINVFGYKLFEGGFIGVDIFFVISGYLITSLILNELKKTKKFSFTSFYERRARRILPALFTVIIFSIPLAWMYLIPPEFIDFSKSIVSSIFFWSNFYFYNSGLAYNDISSLLKPFLHTWSLSVEIQFYILFPIFFIFCLKFFEKRIIFIFLLIIFISLMGSTWLSQNYPSLSFYIFPTRLWELLAGAIISKAEMDYGRNHNKILSNVFPSIGILIIIFSFIYFDHNVIHPSFYTALPVIGVALIMWFANDDELITKVLSSKIFVGVGLISYSMYLYHYPIFAYARITEFSTESIFKQLMVGVSVFALSILTYFIIEKPFRNRNFVTAKFALSNFILLQTLIIFFNFYTIQQNGFMKRFPDIIIKNLDIYQTKNWDMDWKINSDTKTCYDKINDFCIYNRNGKAGRVYLVGDSHLNTLKNDLRKKLIKKDYEFVPIIRFGCWYLPYFNSVNLRTKKIKKGCDENNQEQVRNMLLSKNDSIIIIGGRLPLYLSSKYFDNKEGGVEWHEEKERETFLHKTSTFSISEGIQNSINDLLDNKQKIILIYPIPEVGWHVLKKIIIDLPFKTNSSTSMNKYKLTTSYDVYKKRTKTSFELFDSIKHDNLYRVYPHTLFCNTEENNRCITHNNEDVFYMDDDHLSVKGSEMLNKLILKQIYNLK